MKYLKDREKFLRVNTEETSLKINEAESGPFANDIPWNDSLLGRLINSTIRKAKIGANLVRIKAVNNRLRDCFEELLGRSAVAGLSKEDKAEVNKVVIYKYLEALKNAIESGEDVEEIKRLTDGAIKDIRGVVEKTPADELSIDKDELLTLIKQLEEFRKFLDTLSESEEKEDEKEESKTDEDVNGIFYTNSLNLLKSVVQLNTFLNDDNFLKSLKNTGKKETKPVQQKELVPESFEINESVEALNSWEKSLKTLETSGIEALAPKISDLIKKAESGSELEKKWIVTIGKQVVMNEQTIGKSVISYDALIKENVVYNDIPKAISLFGNVILAFKGGLNLTNELGKAGESIKLFINSYSKLKELLPKLKSSEVKTESLIRKYSQFLLIKEAEENKEGESKEVTSSSTENKGEEESKEATASSTEDSQVTEPKQMTVSQKIKDYWDKKVDFKKFVMSRSEEEKIELNIQEISKKQSIVIDGLDPIIEIVKVFNRAYKLHTTQVIPTGRSGGKVSNKTFMEYTSFGDGRPETAGASGGPYRNNAIFNSWENAVQDIMKDTKYQKIFRQETTLKTASGKIIKDAGINLLKFMNDMLDGETLYKSGGANGMGKQAEFIQKYFDPDAKIDAGKLTYSEKESEEITQNSDAIKDHNVSFTDKAIKFEKYTELAGTFFAIDGNFDKKEGIRYFYIQSVQGDYAYVVLCRSLWWFREYIKSTGVAFKNGISQGNLPNSIIFDKQSKNKDYQLKGCRIKLTDLIDANGNYKLVGGTYKIKSINKYETGINNSNKESELSEKENVVKVTKVYTMSELAKNEEGKDVIKRFKIKAVLEDKIRTIGGFVNVKGSKGISQTDFKK